MAELALPLVVAVRTGAKPERARGQCWPVLLSSTSSSRTTPEPLAMSLS